jgi:hypothetical protein
MFNNTIETIYTTLKIILRPVKHQIRLISNIRMNLQRHPEEYLWPFPCRCTNLHSVDQGLISLSADVPYNAAVDSVLLAS